MMPAALRARIRGIGLVAPGIGGWEEGAQMLTGRRDWQQAPLAIPATEFLPPAERRRAGKAIRLALGCGHQALSNSGLAAAEVASVFASADVDAENTHQICVALTEAEPSLSPTRFHNSVQNAVSGYWTIFTGSRAPTTMVMGGDEIFALGLLEAMSQTVDTGRPVLLVVFDVAMPAPLYATHPIEGGGALALVLDAGEGADGQAGAGAGVGSSAGAGASGVADQRPTIAVQLTQRSDVAGRDAEVADDVPEALAPLRRIHPIGKALPILAQVAGCARRNDGPAVDPARRLRLDLDRYHWLQVTIDR